MDLLVKDGANLPDVTDGPGLYPVPDSHLGRLRVYGPSLRTTIGGNGPSLLVGLAAVV